MVTAQRTLLRPSYRTGFARSAAESMRPHDWDGLVGLWVPALGPSGLTLYDWSGYKRDGALTNMVAASDWVLDATQGYVLDFSGDNDHVSVDSHAAKYQSLSEGSIVVWFRVNNSTAQQAFFSISDGGDDESYGTLDITGAGVFRVRFQESGADNIRATGGTYDDDLWHMCVFQVDSDGNRAYIDAVQESLSYTGGSSSTQFFFVDIPNIDTLRFGNEESGSATKKWTGQIGQVRIYNRALLPREIREIYEDPWGIIRPRQMSIVEVAAVVVATQARSQAIIIA